MISFYQPPPTTSYEEPWKANILGFWKEYIQINVITYDCTIEDERLYWEHSISPEQKKRGGGIFLPTGKKGKKNGKNGRYGIAFICQFGFILQPVISCLVPQDVGRLVYLIWLQHLFTSN